MANCMWVTGNGNEKICSVCGNRIVTASPIDKCFAECGAKAKPKGDPAPVPMDMIMPMPVAPCGGCIKKRELDRLPQPLR